MSPLTPVSVGLVGVGLYFASIGPLAGLEVRGYGGPEFWRSLKPAYFPLFWSWKHGPQWWANSLWAYTRFFQPERGYFWGIYEFALPNDATMYRVGPPVYVCPSHGPGP